MLEEITVDQALLLGTDALIATGQFHPTWQELPGEPIDYKGFGGRRTFASVKVEHECTLGHSESAACEGLGVIRGRTEAEDNRLSPLWLNAGDPDDRRRAGRVDARTVGWEAKALQRPLALMMRSGSSCAARTRKIALRHEGVGQQPTRLIGVCSHCCYRRVCT